MGISKKENKPNPLVVLTLLKTPALSVMVTVAEDTKSSFSVFTTPEMDVWALTKEIVNNVTTNNSNRFCNMAGFLFINNTIVARLIPTGNNLFTNKIFMGV